MADQTWTVMVYLAGENNLSEECVFALKDMKRAGPDVAAGGDKRHYGEDSVKIIAQLDASGLGGIEERFVISRGDVDGELATDVVTTRDTSETSYRLVLKDFVSWGLARYGTEHNMVVLSGHGSGADGDFLSRNVDPPDALSVPKLQWVFEEVRKDFKEGRGDDFKIDVLGMDSCLMSTAEVCYELRNHVSFMVGAEGFEPNTGWPFERILSALFADPGMDAGRLANTIVEKYVRYYKDYRAAGRSVDQAACDLSICDELAREVRTLAGELKGLLSTPAGRGAILLAHWEAQSYKDEQYTDLYDFCDLLERGSNVLGGGCPQEEVRKACVRVKSAIDRMVSKSCFSGPAVQYSRGLSIYFPWAKVSENYRDLEFAHDTGWHEFLDEYVEKTRREPRKCEPVKSETKTKQSELVRRFGQSGFSFLPTGHRNSIDGSRNSIDGSRLMLANKVGSMKNPPTSYYDCGSVFEELAGGTKVEPVDESGTGARAEILRESASQDNVPANARSNRVSNGKKSKRME